MACLKHRLAKLKKKICHCKPECGKLLVYRSRLRHYHALRSAERPLKRGSESPTEHTTYASLATDIEMGAGAPLTADARFNGMESATNASCNEDDFFNSSQPSMSCSEGESDGDMFHQYIDDASAVSEEGFPDDDAWNRYNENEELDAEVWFRQFEELLDAEVDIEYEEGKL
jgi:hypothetical protein